MEDVAGDSKSDSSLKRLFVFHECAPTLQNIASHEVALQLWHKFFTLVKCGQMPVKAGRRYTEQFHFVKGAGKRYYFYSCLALGLDEDYKDRSDKLVESLEIPRLIEEMLKKSLDIIRTNVENWISHFEETIFEDELKRYYLHDYNPNHIVWHQNGEIDYKKSASKMLSDGNLETEQKFIIMCFYGMADDIERFPVSSLSEYFNQRGIFSFEISYWISQHRDELDNLLREMEREYSVMFPDEEYPSIDTMVAILCAKFNRPLPYAFEYFWNRLNEDAQVLAAVKILPQSPKHQKFILTKMSPFQQRQLLNQIPIELMMNFCIELDMPENAFLIWAWMRDVITAEQFAQFIGNVFYLNSEKCMIMLNNVWDSASNYHKRYVAEANVDRIFRSFQNNWERSPSTYRLFIKFLSMVNRHTRNQMILAEESRILLAKSVDDLDAMIDILNICLQEADQSRFKNSVINSSRMENYFVTLLNDLQFDKLITKVAFYSPNAHITREFIAKLLKSDEFDKEMFLLNSEKWNQLSAFIDAAFPTDLPTACELKKYLLSSKMP